MENSALLTHIDVYGCATITMNRPELHNAFDDTLVAAMTRELLRLESDNSVCVVVLEGSGKSFSAGADLNWMRRMAGYTKEQNLSDAMGVAELMSTLNNLRKPTIAMVQGAAYGGGVGLVACCDIAIASKRASFCLSEVKLGLIPAVISPYVVAAIGSRAARRYFLTADAFDSSEALRIGLVHAVVEEEQLQATVYTLFQQLRKNGPLAMAAAKDLVAMLASGPLDNAMVVATAELIADLRASAEGREGLSAFLEKRQPAWVRNL